MKGVATTNKTNIELKEMQKKLEDQNKNDVNIILNYVKVLFIILFDLKKKGCMF
jgi:hypothetical protein